MIRCLVFILLLSGPGVAVAETVRVRSGEHADFTRLLIEFDQPEDWVFGRVEGGYEMRPARDDIAYDLSRSFDIIPRTRVANLTDRGRGRLFLSVDCDCHADAFDLERGQVVLDIKDGIPASANAPFEVHLDDAGPETAGSLHSDIEDAAIALTTPIPGLSAQAPAVLRAGLPLFPPDQSGPSPSLAEGRPISPTDPGKPTPVPGETGDAEDEAALPDVPVPTAPNTPAVVPVGSDRVAETEMALLEQIARAASQGLLEADMNAMEAEVEAATNPLEFATSPDEDADPYQPPLPAVTPRGHISVETSVDRAFAADQASAPKTDDGQSCLQDKLVDITTWGGGTAEGGDIGAFRSKIVGEFDIADGQGITDLARHYIFMTFGAEAKALIHRYPKDVTRPDVLMAMANVMDQGHANDPVAMIDQMACEGSVALWAVLAQPELYRGQSINTTAVASTFSSLPAHLRRHLGPGLAEKLLEIGDTVTADILRKAVERVEPDPSVPLALVNAQFDFAAGDAASANAKLDDVVGRADEDLPKALLDRAEAALAADMPVPKNVIELLNSVAFEMRGTETGARLRDAEIRSLISVTNFDAAFGRLQDARADAILAEPRLANLESMALNGISADASDEHFLRLATPRIRTAARQPGEVRRTLARRLLDLGLSDSARLVLGGEGALPNREDRVLFAQIAIIDRRPDVAIGYLAGLDGSEAKRLRAQALAAAQDFAGAVRAFGEIGAADEQRRVAWQGGLWEAVSALGEGPEAAVARLVIDAAGPESRDTTESPNPTRRPKTPLAESRLLIENSRTTRATLDALLSEIDALPSVVTD